MTTEDTFLKTLREFVSTGQTIQAEVNAILKADQPNPPPVSPEARLTEIETAVRHLLDVWSLENRPMEGHFAPGEFRQAVRDLARAVNYPNWLLL